MASIFGSVTIAGDPDDWIACAFDADTHTFAGVAAVSGGAYAITGLTAGRAYVVACRPKTGSVWVANKSDYSEGDLIIPATPTDDPYIFKASSVTVGDIYWSDVVLLLNGNGSGNDFSTADALGHTVTPSNDAAFSSAKSKFGESSISFDGSGDYLTISDSSDFTIATSESFCFECWAYLSSASVNRAIFAVGTGASTRWVSLYVKTDLKPAFYLYSSEYTSTAAMTLDTWHHIALRRSSGAWALYLDGISRAAATATAGVNPTYLMLGRDPAQTAWDFSGYLDDIRLTIGQARYTSTFTPPTEAFVSGLGVPTGATEPTWPATTSNTVVDGGVTWTNMGQLVRPLMHGPLIAA